jgi:hypothetical protein
MQRGVFLMILLFSLITNFSTGAIAEKSSSDLIKQGLLGAGAGAVGGSASGGKSGGIWKGALAGAGVNVVGGALLDSITGEEVRQTNEVNRMDSRQAYSTGYNDGYKNGYKEGYKEGYREAKGESVE